MESEEEGCEEGQESQPEEKKMTEASAKFTLKRGGRHAMAIFTIAPEDRAIASLHLYLSAEGGRMNVLYPDISFAVFRPHFAEWAPRKGRFGPLRVSSGR